MNRMYPKGAEKLLSGQINFASDAIKVALVDDGYTFSADHEFLDHLGTLVGEAKALQSKVVTGGVFDAEDADFGALSAGRTVKAIVFFKDTGSASTSPLIMYFDEVTGFPFSTNGSGLTVPWFEGATKILSLV